MSKTCTIQSDGRRFYISLGQTRKVSSYKTPANAKRAAELLGLTIEGPLPNPDAISIAHKVQVNSDRFTCREGVALTLVLHSGAVLTGTVEQLNQVFLSLAFKPIRLTKNMLNAESKWIVIDQDTPSYCDVGSEAYHSM